MALEPTSFKIFDETREKLNTARKKMSKAMNYSNVITWDTFFDILMNMYLPEIENSLEKSYDLMKEETSKISALRIEMKEYFKRQDNQFEELIGEVVKQNQTTHEDLKFIIEFNKASNDNLQNLFEKINKLLISIGDMSNTISQKITQKIKQQIGIAVSFIMHYIIRDNNLHLKKTPIDEAVKEVNKVVNSYKNLYDSSEQYSASDIEKIFDKYSMKEQLNKE